MAECNQFLQLPLQFYKVPTPTTASNDPNLQRYSIVRGLSLAGSVDMADFVGEFRHPSYGLLQVNVTDNKLVMRWGSSFSGTLDHVGKDVFWWTATGPMQIQPSRLPAQVQCLVS